MPLFCQLSIEIPILADKFVVHHVSKNRTAAAGTESLLVCETE